MQNGLHYPDNLYADHEERKARARQAPVGAYRAPTEMPEAERKLRTALAYVNHARDLIREALGDTLAPERIAKVAAGNSATVPGYPVEGVPPERVPKWDPAWGKAPTTVSTGLAWNGPAPPNCDGHPMQAEAIRDHDERLAGGGDRL